MVRAGGLASDHHMEGPGDAPRRRRGRKSGTSSSQPSASSNGTKRAASQDADGNRIAKSKKAKRVQIDEEEEEDHMPQELDEAASQSQTNIAPDRPSHRRRHSEPLANPDTDEEEGNAEITPPRAFQPIHGLTPHLHRIGAEQQVKNTRRSRMSMPAQFHITDVDEVESPREVQFAPLTAVLDSRVKRRLRRSHLSEEVNDIEHHKKDDAKLRKAYADVRRQLRDMEQKYADLTLELEASRLGNIDMSEDQHEEYQEKLEDELQDAREVINKLRASSIFDAQSRDDSELRSTIDDEDKENMDENDAIMLVDPEDLNMTVQDMQVSPLDNGYYATRAVEMSQIIDTQVTYESLATIPETSQDSILETSQIDLDASVGPTSGSQATQRFENEIATLTAQLSQTRGALRIVTIKLQNMNITHPGESVNVIITELQRALDHVLVEYERLEPGSTSDATSSEVLYKMVEAMKCMNKELLEKVVVAEKYYKLTTYLRQQNSRLLDLQADTEGECTELDELVIELKAQNAQKDYDIKDLDEALTAMSAHADGQDELVASRGKQIHELQFKLKDAEVDKERLRESLQNYREELEKTTQTIVHLEKEHAEQITGLAREHAEEMNDLETQRDEEMSYRIEAEEGLEERNTEIKEYEIRFVQMEQELEVFTSDLETLRQLYENEKSARADVEYDLDEVKETLSYREKENEKQNDTIQHIHDQLNKLNHNLETEKAHRGKTENLLSEANIRLDDLNDRLRTAEVQANTLRAELFQEQEAKREAINELMVQSDARATSLEDTIQVATQRYSDAEGRISKLEAEVARLTQDLVTVEDSLSDLSHRYDALQLERDATVAKLETQLEELQKKHAALEATSESTIESLEAEVADRDVEVSRQKVAIVDLEDAAVQLKADMHEMQQQHDTEIAEKNAYIEHLNVVGSAHVDNLISLHAELEDLKVRFREQAEDSQNTIDALVETNREALAKQEQLATEAKKRTRIALSSVAEMKVDKLDIKAYNVNLKKVATGKVTQVSDRVAISKKSRGRRASKPRDSGFVEPLSDADYEPSASDVESALAA